MNLTTLQELSSTLIQRLNVTSTELLSALNGIEDIPAHPYEKLKYEHFDTDYKFKTIDDLDVPCSFCTTAATQSLTAISAQHETLHQTHIENLNQYETLENLGNGFAVLSGDKMVVDTSRLKNYIEFHEIVRSIPIDSINVTNCNEIMQKLINRYIGIWN